MQQCGVHVAEETAQDLKIVYTPIHGSGREYVLETLRRAGFTEIMLVREQADYNGDFPTVNKPNPEDSAVFAMAEKLALENHADIIIGTDPDSDRIGVGVNDGGRIIYLSGNRIGTLLVDFLCRTGSAEGKKLITSIVTGDMGPAVAASYGVDTVRTYTGFKNLGNEMNKLDSGQILMAYEESFGYLVGTHIRDKDGVSAALVVCRMASYWKKRGYTLAGALEELFKKYGYYIDDQSAFVFEGAAGAEKIAGIMTRIRESRETVFSEIGEVTELLDYSLGIDGLPPDNVLKYIFNDGSWLAVRPSGTEPKIKFYYCIKGDYRETAEKIHATAKECVERILCTENH